MKYKIFLLLVTFSFTFAQDLGLFINSDFGSDADNWELILTGNAEAESALKDGANCVTITKGGRDIFGVQLQRAGFGLLEGKSYQLSFDAYASSERAVRVKIGQAASPFTEYFMQNLELSSETRTFNLPFSMTKIDEANVKMTLFMGGKNDAPFEVCLDNIKLGKAEVAVGINLIENGDFASEENWNLFAADGAEAKGRVVDGEYCAFISQSGENMWSVGLTHGGIKLGEGKRYSLSVDAYADNEVTLGIKLGQSVDPFTEYFREDKRLTSEKTTYTVNPEIYVTDANANLELFMGGPNTPTVPTTLCLDNLVLQEVTTESAARVIPYIMVDQFGYRPQDKKVAVLVDPQVGFNADDSFEPSGKIEVRKSDDDSVVFTGDIVAWNNGQIQANSGDKGWWFDFSGLSEPGEYYLIDPVNDTRSYEFEIHQDVYKNVLKAAMRMFYYNRANTAKVEPYADPRWTDLESYVGPGQDTEAHYVEDKTNEELVKDLSGGWFDAGDTNKYVTFALSPVHILLTAYEQNPQAFGDDFNIPESGNGIPDVLDEVKWETDWLKKMQIEDGGVIIKMGDIDYSVASPPSKDTGARFYGPVCSSSSIAASSMFAHAALVFAAFPKLADEVEDLQERALRAYEWYEKNPKRDDCDDGEIKAGDADDSIVEQEGNKALAAVYLFALTGEDKYKVAVEANHKAMTPFNDGFRPRWGMYNIEQGDALLYYTRLENADPTFANFILSEKTNQAAGVSSDIFGFQADKDLYRAYMRDESLHWGSNFPRANLGSLNMDFVHYQLTTQPAFYTERAQGILNYFHGVNPLNMVYLTNMAEDGAEYSANEIYHLWFTDGSIWDNALTSERGPAPGYVPGGPNQYYSGESAPPVGEPAQKAYRDWNSTTQPSYEITEPAIYYQAAYVRLLANFVGE